MSNSMAGDTGVALPGEIDVASVLDAAITHHRAGRSDEAERMYRRILQTMPEHPNASHLLGVIEIERERPARGAELIRRALPALADLPEPHIDLGNALRLTGKREEAVESYRRALAVRPDFVLAHACLGSLLTEMGRLEAALGHCRAAMAIDSKFLPARIIFAIALQAAGRMPEAAQAWRDVLALEPDRPESFHRLAGQLIANGSYKEALYCCERAIVLQPNKIAFHCARGHCLMRLYDGPRAELAFRRALSLSPDSKEALAGLSWALRLLGRFDEADACAKRLNEIDPSDLRNVAHVSSTGRHAKAADEIDRLRSVLDGGDEAFDDQIIAGFALGRLLDGDGHYEEAFGRYQAANALARKHWPPTGDSFNAEKFSRSIDALIATNTAQTLADAATTGNISELPVFVLGMPRSGTTLVEQICASHPRIYGAGELDSIPRIAFALAPHTSDGKKLAAAARQQADAHIVHLHRRGHGALRVVDKMPDNILLVGVIARLFPRARIVYCSRDPRDISLSCYFQRFSPGAQYFSYDLADCGKRCREVQRLAAHWLALLSFQMIEVNYEKLVADLEGESRRLIEFLGLPWEPACLDFYRTERTVATVSHWQVRQPIYSSSIGRWRRYERYLGPLFTALGDPVDGCPSAQSCSAPAHDASS